MTKEAEKLQSNFIKASNWFHENVVIKLPEEIQTKIKNLGDKTFSHELSGTSHLLIISSEKIDITEYVKDIKIKTIFDFYNEN